MNLMGIAWTALMAMQPQWSHQIACFGHKRLFSRASDIGSHRREATLGTVSSVTGDATGLQRLMKGRLFKMLTPRTHGPRAMATGRSFWWLALVGARQLSLWQQDLP